MIILIKAFFVLSLSYLLKQMCSLLSHYSTLLANMDFLQIFIQPFVEYLGKTASKILIFEVILTYTHYFIKDFLFSSTNESNTLLEINHIPFLKKVSDCLNYHDNQLSKAFIDENINLMEVMLPIIRSSFKNILDKQDWLRLMDFLFVHNDKFDLLIFFLVSFLRYFRTSFLNAPDKKTMLLFFERINPCNMETILGKSLKLSNQTPINIIKSRHPNSNQKLTILTDLSEKMKENGIKYLPLGGKINNVRYKIAKEQKELEEINRKTITSHFERERLIKDEEAKRLELEATIKVLKHEKRCIPQEIYQHHEPEFVLKMGSLGSDENKIKDVSEISHLQEIILGSIKARREIKEIEMENERKKWEEFRFEKQKNEVSKQNKNNLKFSFLLTLTHFNITYPL